ncbi:MAG: NAD-dependent epimerase/dehydratase family protein [Desulfobacterales bacterium]|nr:NAD-dependent epimerase/dehydratase family protein [Desulfobacterales bacterium]
MKCLVTGAAGFIGSHLSKKLINEGYEVIGIDCFVDYYPRALKERNIKELKKREEFKFIEANLVSIDLGELISDISYIFHQAAQAGVRASWGESFHIYSDNNILATQRLLEASIHSGIKKFVFASSSSVYGDTEDLPMRETSILKPVSPYGVSKLAAEHLCYLYYKNYKLPTLSLRYFTVYGPGQRPDMAFNRFIASMLKRKEITVYGNGEQTRDFTYIDDIVDANILAMKADSVGEVFNIGGGSRVTINSVLKILTEILSVKAKINYKNTQKGDVGHTCANISKAENAFGYRPKVTLCEGLKKEYEWLRDEE